MNGYLGEFDVDISTTEFAKFTTLDWVQFWIASYGQIDGSHHKMWTLDQCTRIIKGTPIILKEARWENDGEITTELRYSLGEPSKEYEQFVSDYEEDGEYEWNTGGAP